MNQDQILQLLISSLGSCLVAIGWWVATSLSKLNDKMDRVLVEIASHKVEFESHDERLLWLESKNRSN